MFRLGELFCGPGGLAWGATNADIGDDNYKIVHAWANDYDQSTCDTYISNICPQDSESVICGDVRKLSQDGVLEKLPPIVERLRAMSPLWEKIKKEEGTL